jgi:hypothetical protein
MLRLVTLLKISLTVTLAFTSFACSFLLPYFASATLTTLSCTIILATWS